MPYPDYTDVPARLASLNDEAKAAYVRHARRPSALGADTAHRKLWFAVYETRAALNEQNPVVADASLPAAASPVVTGLGLPLIPAGVYWAVDEAAPGTLSLAFDLAGAPNVTVLPPGSATPFLPVVTLGATRQTTTFAAPVDGIYTVTLDVAGAHLATLYLTVTRGEFALFREDVRGLGYGFRLSLPKPTGTALARLARLAAAESAARTGQTALAARLLASARALPAPEPASLYPYHRCDD